VDIEGIISSDDYGYTVAISGPEHSGAESSSSTGRLHMLFRRSNKAQRTSGQKNDIETQTSEADPTNRREIMASTTIQVDDAPQTERRDLESRCKYNTNYVEEDMEIELGFSVTRLSDFSLLALPPSDEKSLHGE